MNPSHYSTGPAFAVLDDHRPVRLDRIVDRLSAAVEEFNAAPPATPESVALFHEVQELRYRWRSELEHERRES